MPTNYEVGYECKKHMTKITMIMITMEKTDGNNVGKK